MSEIRGETGTARVASGPRRRGSPGLPALDLATDERIAELEARLARLEATPGLRERGRSMINRVMPPEASRHFRNAGREQLLGVRSIVDFWIQRIESAEARAATNEPVDRETIEIE